MIDRLLEIVKEKTEASKIAWTANPDINGQFSAHVSGVAGTEGMDLRIRRIVSTVTVPRKLSWPLSVGIFERLSEPVTEEKIVTETVLDILKPDSGQQFHIEATKLPKADRSKLQSLFDLIDLQIQQTIAEELIPVLETV